MTQKSLTQMTRTQKKSTQKKYHYLLAIGFFLAFVVFVALRQTSPFQIGRLDGYVASIFGGFLRTILVSFIALIGSTFTGFLLFLMSKSNNGLFRAFVDVFTEIIYGTPLLVAIIMMAWVVGPAFNTYNRPVLGVIGLIVYITPYMTNIFRSAFKSIPEEQYLAMDVFGFTNVQKYIYIIIPQVLRILMPPLMNNFSLIIKGSALLHVIAYGELFHTVGVMQSRTFGYAEGYITMWALYIIITIPLSQFTRYFERRWSLE